MSVTTAPTKIVSVDTVTASGVVLDYLVAKSLPKPVEVRWDGASLLYNKLLRTGHTSRGEPMIQPWQPSKDWSQGGPIMEGEWMIVRPGETPDWQAEIDGIRAVGPAMLVAAMRCYVRLRLGATASVPAELIGGRR